jgi:murein DD-endopeptidase MepM/ murein hydrolase activator NlpD
MNNSGGKSFKRTLVIVYLLAIHTLAGIFVYERFLKPYSAANSLQAELVKDPNEKPVVPTPQPIPSVFADPPADENAQAATANVDLNLDNSNQSQTNGAMLQPSPPLNYPIPPAEAPSGKIMIPVVGVRREQIRDTFNAARSGGRVHDANDIMAAGGTPVVACTDGKIAKFFDSVRGGITIYQYSADKSRVYYYAHLQKRADNLKEHDFVKQGTVIGYVGDTGNSGAGNYHLHFAITILTDPKNIFKGNDINPYPLLKDGIEAR